MRELIARNQVDQAIYQPEKAVKEAAGLTDRDRAPVQAAIDRAREAAKSGDVQTVRRAVKELQAAAQAMAQDVQEKHTAGAASGGGPGVGDGRADGQGKEDVIDPEFEVKK